MPSANFLSCGDCDIAYLSQPGRSPTIAFLGGFKSHMGGTKAEALAAYCRDAGNACLRMDYSGHGQSGGDFADATIGAWRAQALAVIDAATNGPLLLVGSSMGAWIMLLVALARPERIAAMIGIAAAVDMTERLLEPRLTAQQRDQLHASGTTLLASDYDPKGYRIGEALLQEGRKHLLLGAPIDLGAPLRLLHGRDDQDVPWQLSLKLMQQIASKDVTLQLVKGADHRFSSPANLQLLMRTVDEFIN